MSTGDLRRTGFFWDERCFWLAGGNYAFMLPVGDLVQPLASGGLPENPETKRRFKNLVEVTGLADDLVTGSAPAATMEDLARVHTQGYLAEFKRLSNDKGGEIGLRAPFGPGGFEQAAQSTGLIKGALAEVMAGRLDNAYALCRPPGHHCLPDWPNGFCLFNNIAVALEAARADTPDLRAVILDWDVHHGNGTEAIYLGRADTLAISIHQERNYPLDTGAFDVRGDDAGLGYNLNIPLPAGAGHESYSAVMEQVIGPQIAAFAPDVIIVACGFDAAALDPLGRMLAHAGTFRAMTKMVRDWADDLCDGRLVMAHEGGYLEVYVPFCGHAVLEEMSGSAVTAPDPFAATFAARQPGPAFDTFCAGLIRDMASAL